MLHGMVDNNVGTKTLVRLSQRLLNSERKTGPVSFPEAMALKKPIHGLMNMAEY
jgi:hypothetical protein